jgi:hypothetical protein
MIIAFSSVSPFRPSNVEQQSVANGLLGGLATHRISNSLALGTVVAAPIKIFAFVPGTAVGTLKGRTKIAARIAASAAPVAGISWRFSWSTLEPADGTYNWTPIDDAIQATKLVKKLVMIRVIAGMQSPTWVVSASPTISFPNTVLHNPAAYPSRVIMPLPWGTNYLAKWAAFIKKFAQRYDGNPAIYSVQTSGTGLIGDMYLPNAIIPQWVAAGYTDAKLIDAAKSTLRYFESAFTITRTNLDIAEPLSGYSHVLDSVMQYVFAKYPSTVYVQQNGLKSKDTKYPKSSLRTFVRQAGASYGGSGYQMNGAITKDPSIGPARVAFQIAVDDHVSYVEIYEPDILNPALLADFKWLVAH